MSKMKEWENKIKMIRSQTPFRAFIKELASWMPIVLYKTQEGYLSRYPDTPRVAKKLSPKKYYQEVDDFINRWIDVDFSITFFENYKKLLQVVPLLGRVCTMNAENSDFAESVVNVKNVYLSYIVINGCENVFYTFYAQDNSKDIFNSVMVWDHSQIVYFWVAIIKSYKIFYSRFIVDSNNIWFSTNLMWCSECIFCDGLENKKYHIYNKEYSKEEYFTQKEKILQEREAYSSHYELLEKNAKNFASEKVQGQFCVYSSNVQNGYFTYRLQNARNVFFVGDKEGRKNVLDTLCSDDPWFGDIYASLNLWGANNVYMVDCSVWQNLYYCHICIDCSFCIGCTWLFNKQYCILNKQYTKEAWNELAPKIFAQMEKDGILWKFWPASMNPFYFNDTLAYLIDSSFTKQEVTQDGFMWRENEVKVDIPQTENVISNQDLQKFQSFKNGKWKIDPTIVEKIIKDEKGNYYKILKEEFDFLSLHWLPLPELHWLERIRINLNFT